MEPSNDLVNNTESSNIVSMFILTLQLFAWLFAVSYFFGDYSGSDPAGNAMAEGLTVVFIIIPSMVFIFFSNLYLMLKKNLNKFYRYIAAANFLGLVVLASNISW